MREAGGGGSGSGRVSPIAAPTVVIVRDIRRRRSGVSPPLLLPGVRVAQNHVERRRASPTTFDWQPISTFLSDCHRRSAAGLAGRRLARAGTRQTPNVSRGQPTRNRRYLLDWRGRRELVQTCATRSVFHIRYPRSLGRLWCYGMTSRMECLSVYSTPYLVSSLSACLHLVTYLSKPKPCPTVHISNLVIISSLL